jgi:hypothetical protein
MVLSAANKRRFTRFSINGQNPEGYFYAELARYV